MGNLMAENEPWGTSNQAVLDPSLQNRVADEI